MYTLSMNWMADDFFFTSDDIKGQFFCDTYMFGKERIFFIEKRQK